MFEKFRDYREEYCYVKYQNCTKKLYVNKGGQVFDIEVGVLPVRYNAQGERVVISDLWAGPGEYLVSMLVLLAYDKLKLPSVLFDQVEPFHIDNNVRNCHPSNIGYRFKSPIESKRYPGFYYIPFFSEYVISKEGIIKNLRTGKESKGSNKSPSKGDSKKNITGGYVQLSLKFDTGQHTSLGRHRVLMLAFTNYPNDVDRLDVNHKDGIPGNDWLDNLEWATRTENNLHAVRSGLRTQNIPCYAKNVFTGEEKEFASYTDCARYFQIGPHSVISRVETEKLHYGGWLFKDNKDKPWRVPEDAIGEMRADSNATGIVSFNIFTGEERRHVSIAQCGKELGLTGGNQGPRGQLASGRFRPYYGYLFKYDDDNTPWPEFTAEQLWFYRENPHGRARAVVAKHENGEEILFANIKKVAEHFKDTLRTPKHVCKAIERQYNVDGWYLSYKSI